VVQAVKFFVLCEGWGVASTAFGRISFSVYLLQFVMFKPKRKFLLWFFMVGQAVVNALTIILIYVQCGTQAAALWDPSIKANCWSPVVQRDFGFFQCGMSPRAAICISRANQPTMSAYNSLTDLFLTVLPTTIVWNLPISWRKKLGVSVLLGVSVV
jgi:hypothetical protein